jgi:hypothetical protein
MTQDAFLHDLAARIPAVQELERGHFEEFGEILPTVFMGAITRLYCEACRRDWPGDVDIAFQISAHLETGWERGDESIRDLIMLGFVENLLGEDNVPAIRQRLGPSVAEAFNSISGKKPDRLG